jgi:hypothetical protein
MTRTPEARRTARTAQVVTGARTTPTPVEHDMLRDMAMVLKLTAKLSREIRTEAAGAKQ